MAEKETGGKNTESGQTHEREPRLCNYCGARAPLVWVHGHGQCANCGINVEECCRGEQR